MSEAHRSSNPKRAIGRSKHLQGNPMSRSSVFGASRGRRWCPRRALPHWWGPFGWTSARPHHPRSSRGHVACQKWGRSQRLGFRHGILPVSKWKNILLILLYPFISYYLMILVSTCKSGRITRYYHLIVILYDQFCRSRATARSLAKLQCEQAARNQLAINPFHLSFKFPGEMLLSTTHDYTL